MADKNTKIRQVLSKHINLLSVGEDYLSFLAEDIAAAAPNVSSAQDLKPLLEDVANTKEGVKTVCTKLYKALESEGIFSAPEAEAEQEEDQEGEEKKGTPDVIPVSESKLKRVFGKELKKRRGEPEIPPAMLQCNHKWHGDPFGGPHCMVCDFETTNRTWCCSTCDLKLCGSCWFKWSHKM